MLTDAHALALLRGSLCHRGPKCGHRPPGTPPGTVMGMGTRSSHRCPRSSSLVPRSAARTGGLRALCPSARPSAGCPPRGHAGSSAFQPREESAPGFFSVSGWFLQKNLWKQGAVSEHPKQSCFSPPVGSPSTRRTPSPGYLLPLTPVHYHPASTKKQESFVKLFNAILSFPSLPDPRFPPDPLQHVPTSSTPSAQHRPRPSIPLPCAIAPRLHPQLPHGG